MPVAPLTYSGLGSWPSNSGEIWNMPALPPGAWSYPIRFSGTIRTSTYRPLLSLSLVPGLSAPATAPHYAPIPLFDLTEDVPWEHGWTDLSFGVTTFPTPRPTQVAIFRNGAAAWPHQVLSLTVEYTDPGGGGGAGEVRLTKVVEGVDLADLIGTRFEVTADAGSEAMTTHLEVVEPGTILSETIALSSGLVVTFSENMDLLPTVIGGKAARWAEAVFTPPSVTVVEDSTIDVMVWNRVSFPGGMWPLRQRQSLIGAGAWPLRQRQNGAHSGSWALRQTQTGI